MKKIVVLGGCGFIGSVLVSDLLLSGNKVKVIDIGWFGQNIPAHENLEILLKDVRHIEGVDLSGFETVIHLANIANDPGVDLDPVLSWEVNVLAAQRVAESCLDAGVRRLIYASSGSVYGLKDEEHVTEDLCLVPISVYNKTKMVAERVLLSYRDSMDVHCVRPATVCGCSPRMRLDVSVNLLTHQALSRGCLTVLGGTQVRPNINIKDIVRVFMHFLENPDIESGFYNAGFENLSIMEVAQLVCEFVPASIDVKNSNDPRSYRLCSEKLLQTGFVPRHGVRDAIESIVQWYRDGRYVESEKCYTVATMKNLRP